MHNSNDYHNIIVTKYKPFMWISLVPSSMGRIDLLSACLQSQGVREEEQVVRIR